MLQNSYYSYCSIIITCSAGENLLPAPKFTRLTLTWPAIEFSRPYFNETFCSCHTATSPSASLLLILFSRVPSRRDTCTSSISVSSRLSSVPRSRQSISDVQTRRRYASLSASAAEIISRIAARTHSADSSRPRDRPGIYFSLESYRFPR